MSSMRILLLIISAGSSGCFGASLSSVRATATLAQRVGPFQDTLDQTQSYCEKIERLTNGDPGGACVPPDPQWRRAARVIRIYGATLERLATAQDVQVRDQINSVLDAGTNGQFAGAQLSGQEQGILSMAAQAIVKGVSEGWRLEKIKEGVVQFDPYVQGAVAAMETVLSGQEALLDLLATQVDDYRQRSIELNFRDDPAARPGDVETARRRITRGVLAAYLDDLKAWTRSQRRALVDYRRAVKLFGAAHHALHEHASDFVENDKMILVDIANTIAASQNDNPKPTP